MIVKETELQTQGDALKIQAVVESPFLKEPFLLWHQLPVAVGDSAITTLGDSLVAALLLPAMKTGEAIELSSPVSPQLFKSVKWLQTIYHAWDPTLSYVEIRAPVRQHLPLPSAGVGLFFSLGVDSFYSLVKNVSNHPLNEDTIDSLIFVYGADIYLSDKKSNVLEQMHKNAQVVADQYRKRMVPVVTNVKEMLAAYHIRRGFLGHGTTLAAVGLALQGMFRKIYIASGTTYNDLSPDGSHPLTDPLWSTEGCTFVHDGLEATRLQKVALIAQSEAALNTLRVCWAKERQEYNCGQCSKCLETMFALHLVGALEKARTFPNWIEPELLRSIPVLHAWEFPILEQYLDKLGDSQVDTELRSALLEGLAAMKPYFERVESAQKSIHCLIPSQDRFILVDEETLWAEFGIGQKVIPFLERNGQYNGPPGDDATAIREVERLRGEGANFIVFWWAQFWWLDYYQEFIHYLHAHYPRLLADESLIIFDLRSEKGRVEPDSSSSYPVENIWRRIHDSTAAPPLGLW